MCDGPEGAPYSLNDVSGAILVVAGELEAFPFCRQGCDGGGVDGQAAPLGHTAAPLPDQLRGELALCCKTAKEGLFMYLFI